MTTHVIASINQKGGVGKTTILFGLVKSLAKKGSKCLVIDNDPQGNITGSFLEKGSEKSDSLNLHNDATGDVIIDYNVLKNIDLIGSNKNLAKIADNTLETIYNLADNIEEIKQNYDFIFIDCPPTFGYLNTSALIAANLVMIPTTATSYALEGLSDLVAKVFNIKKMKARAGLDLEILGIVVNLFDGRKTVIQKEIEEVIRSSYEGMVFEEKLFKSSKYEESPTFYQSIIEYAPKSIFAKQFRSFVKEFLVRVEFFSKTKSNQKKVS